MLLSELFDMANRLDAWCLKKFTPGLYQRSRTVNNVCNRYEFCLFQALRVREAERQQRMNWLQGENIGGGFGSPAPFIVERLYPFSPSARLIKNYFQLKGSAV